MTASYTGGGGGGYNVGQVVGTVHLNVAGAIASANQFTQSVNQIPAAPAWVAAGIWVTDWVNWLAEAMAPATFK